MAIVFSSADRKLTLPSKTTLKKFVESIFVSENRVLGKLTYVFCSDEFLLDINQRFLQHDYYTDIITFDLSEDDTIVGEVYLSVDRVKDNAIQSSQSFSSEMLRVIFHGALHLCGYKDKKKSEIAIMREREDHYIRLYEKSLNQ